VRYGGERGHFAPFAEAMTRIARSPEQLDAEAAGPAITAAKGAIRAVVSESSRYSPMGKMPDRLMCATRHAGWLTAYDQHGGLHDVACCLVWEARLEWHYAHPEDIHVFRVPSDLETIPVIGEVLDAGELGGPPFAITFIDYLEYPHESIVRGLREQRRQCASRHSTWADHRGRAVCGSLLWSVIANGNTIDDAADAVDLSPERAMGLLNSALRAVWTWRSREANL
jgi:hypothetical protein